jgi:hypothetical protein
MCNNGVVAVMGNKFKTVCTCVLSFLSPSGNELTKDHHQNAVASGFFISIPLSASVLHTIARPQPGGVEEKGDSVCRWLGGSSRIIRATGRIVKSGAHREFGGMTIPSGGRTLFLLTLYGVGGSLGRKVTHVPSGMIAMKQKMGCYE